MGRGILEGTPRTEQVELEQRTSDPSNPDAQEAWLRVDIKPTYEDADGNQQTGVAEFRIANGDGGVDTAPVAQLGHATGQDVIDKRRVFVDAGGSPTGVGFIPYATASSGLASYPKRRLEHPTDGRLQMHDALYRAIPDSGVGRWNFEDDTDSTVAVDSWNENDGTVNGASYSSTAKVDSLALSFDGTDDNVELGDVHRNAEGGYSFSVWVNPDSVTQGLGTYMSAWDGVDQGLILFRQDGDDLYFYHYNGTYESVSATGVLTAGTYQMVTATYDGAQAEVYVDANSVAGPTSLHQPSSDPQSWALGWNINSQSEYYAGLEDDARLYSKELSATEVSNLHNTGSISG
jgi:hypothetical protein